MKQVAIGIRVHSGWGALVAVCRERELEVVERARVAVVDRGLRGAVQPYHFAATLALEEAERHIATCASEALRKAQDAIGELLRSLHDRGFRASGAAVLTAGGRPLPALAKILAAHPLIHTAEGEFFRQIFRDALGLIGIPVTSIPKRELEQTSDRVFGREAAKISAAIQAAGKRMGRPWTQDQKSAAMAAAIVLAQGRLAAAV
jgi:hypothetical protein